jgi:hypothetical protein
MLMFWFETSIMITSIQLNQHIFLFFSTNQCHKIWPYTHPTLKTTNMNNIEQHLGMVQINITPKFLGRLQLIVKTQNYPS